MTNHLGSKPIFPRSPRPGRRNQFWFALGCLFLIGLVYVSVLVQIEGEPRQEQLGGDGPRKALVLFHPSRDAHFSEDLSWAVVQGLKAAGFAVERATITGKTPTRPQGYALIVVVSNTYYWAPDLPTLRYLERARLEGVALLGLIGGSGSTDRSRRLLDEALRRTGGNVLATRSFWLLRPNDERRLTEPNRDVAVQMAHQFAAEAAQAR